jgi:endonuclease/exonuclease/phosphatase (EEP) superfamily protein YafD
VSAFALLLAAAYAASQVPGTLWMFDNLSNFQPHFAAAFLACAVVLALRRKVLPALACVGLAALVLARVLPWYFEEAPAPGGPQHTPVRLLVANVYYANRDSRRLLALVERENPDVIGLVEVSARWLRRLRPLHAAYPYYYEIPGERHVGLALYSRLPMSNARTLARADEQDSPVIAATLAAPGGAVEILLAHPASPVGAAYIARRNAQVAALAQVARDVDGPLVLAGDLNLTMWNRGYRPLVDVAGLHNARKGHGIGPTWPALGPVGVPIDHVLASPGVSFQSFRVLPRIGSDHLPVAADFTVP